jgi:chromosome segregation ATPase
MDYAVRTVAARFGVVAPRHYLRTATEETILLKQAEILVGKLAWQEVEHVEDLTTEYWRLRQLEAEEGRLQETLETSRQDHDRVQRQSEMPETIFTPKLEEINGRLEKEREHLTARLQSLQEEIHKAEVLRKKFNGLKLKLSVLKAEGAPAEVLDPVRAGLHEVKSAYGDLARNVENLREEIGLLENKAKAIESEEENVRAQISHHQRTLTREVSDVSRRLVETHSRLKVIDGEKQELFGRIGKFLCRGSGAEAPELRPVIARFRPIINRARALARSIEFNRRLADFR